MRESESDSSFCSEKGNQFGAQLRKFPVCCRPAGIHHEVEAGGNQCSRCTENFSNPSLDSIAIVRFAEFPRRCKSDTAVIQPIRHQKDYKGSRNFLCTLRIYVLEFSRLPQSEVFRKCVRLRDRHCAGQASNLIVLNRHTLPAFISSRLQHQPATTCLHPSPKSMCLCAPAIVRLVGSMWHSAAPSKTKNLT